MTKMMNIHKEHFAHILWRFASIRTAKNCHWIFLVIVTNNIYVCISIIKNLLSYIVYIEQRYYSIIKILSYSIDSVQYYPSVVISRSIIIVVIVNYNLSLGIHKLSLGIIYFANFLVFIIIYIIIISSSDIKETTYLDYIQYIIVYIIISNNNIKEIYYLDYIQLYIIIIIIINFSSITDPDYLRNIKNTIIMIIANSSSNINKISLLFNIIDYIINSLLIIIKNIDADIWYIKFINIIHINYKHHIEIKNIKTINIINDNNISKTVNNIYLLHHQHHQFTHHH